MGSVTPLLAIKQGLDTEGRGDYMWIGTANGPEKDIVTKNGIVFKSIPSGKLRRYFDWKNFIDPLWIMLGFLKSLWIVWRFRPDVILTAGSFVSVPLVFAASLFKIRVVIHQQDLKIGLANRLMQRVACKITVAFDDLRDYFPREKVVITGNPVRPEIFNGDKQRAFAKFNLEVNLPVLLIMGGGVGSEIINKVFIENNKEITEFCQVIHVLGKGEQSKWLVNPETNGNTRYHLYDFLDADLPDAYAVADLFFGRAGFSTLTELAAISKPAVIMPIPNHQQVENAEFFHAQKAIVYVRQEDFQGEYIANLLRDLLEKTGRLNELSVNIHNSMPEDATQEYVRFVNDLIRKY